MSKLDAAMAWFDASFSESTALVDARELGHADNSDEAAVSSTAGRELVGAVLSLREQERASAHYVRHWRGRAERAEADCAALREERDRYQQTEPGSASAPATGCATAVDEAIDRLRGEIRTKVEWQVRSETGGIVIGYDNRMEADKWLADHESRFPDSVHGKCHVVRSEWLPQRAEDIRSALAEIDRLRTERDRFHSLLSLTESALMDDSAAITFQSFGQYRDWLLRVMRGKLHNEVAERRPSGK